MKLRILCFPWSYGLARASRLLCVAVKLRESGCEVAFAGEGRYVAGEHSIVRPEGFQVFPIPDILPREQLTGSLKIYTRERVEEFVKAEMELLRDWKPDAVLLDFRATAGLSSRILGIPSFSINLLDSTVYSARRISAPADHPLNLKIQRLLGTRSGQSVSDFFAPFFAGLEFRDSARPINVVAKKYKIKAKRHFFLWLEGTALNFITDVPGWSPAKPLPENFIYSGPIVWNPKGFEDEWDEVKKRIPEERKLVYISFGSTGRDDVFRAVLDYLRNRSEFFVITTGGQIELPEAPENAIIAKFLPGQKVMEAADVVICHGGSGTLFQAMEAAKPVYAIAMRIDQEWNAEEVERLRLGIAAPASAILKDRTRFGRDLDRLLSDPSFKDGTKAFQKKLLEFSGAKKIAEEVINWMNRASV